MSRRQISLARKAAFYGGMAVSGLGLLLFISLFLWMGGIRFFGEPKSAGLLVLQPVLGILLVAGGRVLSAIGKKGLAGAGLILDPEKARADVEPWSRMGGGVIKDALDEAEINLGSKSTALPFDEQLRRLHKLREDGIISEAEYKAKKTRILESL